MLISLKCKTIDSLPFYSFQIKPSHHPVSNTVDFRSYQSFSAVLFVSLHPQLENPNFETEVQLTVCTLVVYTICSNV